jgi:hypothetical protein
MPMTRRAARAGQGSRAARMRPGAARLMPQVPPAGMRPLAAPLAWGAFRSPVLPTLIDAARGARLHQLRAGLTVMRAQVDRLQTGLDAWDRQLAAATGDTTQTVPYDTTDTTAPPVTATAPPPTVAPVPASTTAGAVTSTTTSSRTQPSSRVLYAIFDDLSSRQLTESGYPRMQHVNEALEDEGIGPADTAWVHQKYDAWLHAQDRDRAEEDEDREASGSGKRPSDAVLQSVFATLDLDSSRDMTDSGTPRVKVVNDALEDRGYAHADADKIADAFADWSGGSTLKKPTDSALFAVFRRLDLDSSRDMTSRGMPRVDVVAKALEKNGYAAADADQIAEAFQDWQGR